MYYKNKRIPNSVRPYSYLLTSTRASTKVINASSSTPSPLPFEIHAQNRDCALTEFLTTSPRRPTRVFGDFHQVPRCDI